MAEARRERIAVAVVAALTTGCAPVPVERNRRTPVDTSEAPAIVMFDLGHEASYENAGLVDYTMQIDISAAVTGSDATIGTAVNDLYVRILQSLSDYTLGGLCTGLREVALDTNIASQDESSTTLATFSVSVAVDFMTPDGDPTG